MPDVDAETKKLLDAGCETILSFSHGDNISENYLDTRKYGHVIVSFRPPVRHYEKIWTNHNLSHPMLRNWNFYGIGIGVRDLDKTVDYYEMLKIAEFQAETELNSNLLDPLNIPGETSKSNVKARVRVAQVGPVFYEFFQPK